MKLIPSILAALLALAVPAMSADKKDKDKGKEEAAVPDVTIDAISFKGEVVNGVAFDKASMKGKVVVVEDWGVNCGPCIAFLPEMAKFAKSNEKKGVVVVGIECQGGTNEQIMKLLKPARVAYPVFAGGNSGASTGTIPHACVYGADGKLLWHGNPTDDKFERTVKDALKAVKAVASN
ncbi:TlpA disulfide reductase family protein [Haloferula sp. BvORR071]|uniref:TlpA family protein disulfide reductase n=1 Tax=Haloferula sp. BvORR071 TaxID=1396141 RepID=UPI000695A6EA|nr:TlpA disulfide reductase family protein [Haloferula sp. BvORR071]